jgi:hypothetical protein
MLNLPGEQFEKLMTIEAALIDGLKFECKQILGKNFSKLGFKSKAMLKNITELKKLLWSLQNSDCVTFYV